MPYDLIELKDVDIHTQDGKVWVNTRLQTTSFSIGDVSSSNEILKEQLTKEANDVNDYNRRMEVNLEEEKEEGAIYDLMTTIVTYTQIQSRNIARYGKAIADNQDEIGKLNYKIKMVEHEVKRNSEGIERNTGKIKVVEKRIDDLNTTVISNTQKIKAINKRIDKLLEVNDELVETFFNKIEDAVIKTADDAVNKLEEVIDKVNDNVAKAEDHGGNALTTAFTPLMIGKLAIGCAVAISGGIAMAVKLKISANKVKAMSGKPLKEINLLSLEDTVKQIGRRTNLVLILKEIWSGILLAGFSLMIAEILNERTDIATIFVCIVMGLQFVAMATVLIMNKRKIELTINAVEEHDGQQVIRIRMAWKATEGQICKWMSYWMLLIIPSVVLLLQETGAVNFDEIEDENVNDWWRFAVIGWSILATLYVTARGRQLFVQRKVK